MEEYEINQKIKELFGSKEAFCEKFGYNYKSNARKIKGMIGKIKSINEYLKPLGISYMSTGCHDFTGLKGVREVKIKLNQLPTLTGVFDLSGFDSNQINFDGKIKGSIDFSNFNFGESKI